MAKKIVMSILSVILLLINCIAYSQKLPILIPYREGKLWGYCDSNKKVIIKPKYNLTIADKNAIVSFPLFYDTMDLATIQIGDREIIINRKGKEISNKILKFEKAEIETVKFDGENENERKQVYVRVEDNYFKPNGADDNNKFGEFKYRYPIGGKVYRCFAESDEKKKLVNSDGNIIYDGYRYILPLDSMFILVDKSWKYSIGDRFGKIFMANSYDNITADIKYFEDGDEDKEIYSACFGKYLIVKKGDFYGIITASGKEIIPPIKYTQMYRTGAEPTGFFTVHTGKTIGIIDYKGMEYWKD
jgi:WG containing repeat